MSKQKTVSLDEAFQFGNENTDYFVDFPHLSDAQKVTLATFMGKVLRGEDLRGKNKPSWLDDDCNKIPGTDGYEENNYWHYHCGPGYSDKARFGMTINLVFNANGDSSSEVIHYAKVSSDEIMIVGFSPTHLPFPSSDDISVYNPLFN